jgi:hypothetical protein
MSKQEGESYPSDAPLLRVKEDMSSFQNISHFETKRIYHFGDGKQYVIESPLAFRVSPSGGHRLTSEGGKCHYVPPSFIGIEIFGEWSQEGLDQGAAQDEHDL